MSELPITEVTIPRLREYLDATLAHGDELFTEFEGVVAEVNGTKAPTLEFLTAYIDRFEHRRGQVFRRKWITSRRLSEARDDYYGRLRKSMKRGPMGKAQQLAYDERRAHYESEHIVELQKVELLTRALDECEKILEYINNKQWWLQNMRTELRHQSDQARYASNKDYQN